MGGAFQSPGPGRCAGATSRSLGGGYAGAGGLLAQGRGTSGVRTMTEGASPTGDRRDRDGPPSLRASHADRDRTVEVLRDAAGDGRLTASELDERVEAALTARTGSELAALTADLPTAPRPQAKELVRIDQRFGEIARAGRWVVPKRMETMATAGDVTLDFTDAVITHGTLHIEVDLGMGADLTLVIRPGIVVDVDDLIVRMGDVNVRPAAGGVPVTLMVVVSGRVRGGNVVARFPRRTFREWMRRQPPRWQSPAG